MILKQFGFYSLLLGIIIASLNVSIYKYGDAHTIISITFKVGIISMILGIIGLFKDRKRIFSIIGIFLSAFPIYNLLYLFINH